MIVGIWFVFDKRSVIYETPIKKVVYSFINIPPNIK